MARLLVHSTLYHPQDLGLEGTLLTDALYRNMAFLSLEDPISQDLLGNLARDLQCPKTVRLIGKDHRLGSLGDRGQESPGLGAGAWVLIWLAAGQVTAPLWDLMSVSAY